MVFLRELGPWNEFERLYLFSTITNYNRLKRGVNFFVREFWKSFLLVTLLLSQKGFVKDFWEVSVLSKCFQSLGIESSAILYIYYGWQ